MALSPVPSRLRVARFLLFSSVLKNVNRTGYCHRRVSHMQVEEHLHGHPAAGNHPASGRMGVVGHVGLGAVETREEASLHTPP